MLGQIVGAQFELERAIAELTRSGASAGLAQGQLQALAKLQRQIGDAGGPALASLRAEIATTVSESRAIIQQGANAARGAEAAEIETLATASAAARATAQSFMHDFYERKIFDPYLRFSSVEDEAEYRKREGAYRKAIDAELAKNTPEGDLAATKLARSQLADAGAHGADASPEFADRMASLDGGIDRLGSAIKSSRTERPLTVGTNTVEKKAATSTPQTVAPLADVLATLQAAGISGIAQADQAGHGLVVSAATDRTRGGVG